VTSPRCHHARVSGPPPPRALSPSPPRVSARRCHYVDHVTFSSRRFFLPLRFALPDGSFLTSYLDSWFFLPWFPQYHFLCPCEISSPQRWCGQPFLSVTPVPPLYRIFFLYFWYGAIAVIVFFRSRLRCWFVPGRPPGHRVFRPARLQFSGDSALAALDSHSTAFPRQLFFAVSPAALCRFPSPLARRSNWISRSGDLESENNDPLYSNDCGDHSGA